MKRNSQSNWQVGVLIGSSIPILLMLGGIIIELLTWATVNLRPRTGIEDTTLENALFFGGLYFALPCGLLNLILGIYARSKGRVRKRFAVTVIVLGLLGLIMGGLAWTFVMMMASFVF